jgi:hypothetical protein
MHPTVRLPHSFAQASRARAVLGIEHPLVHVLEREVVIRNDLVVVAALAVPIAAVGAFSVAVALSLLGAVAVTAVGLGCAAAVLRARRREQALTLILEGHEGLPVAAVAAERRRLIDPAYRGMLARCLERILLAAQDQPLWLRSSTIAYSSRTVLAAAGQIREIEALLRGDRPSARGVALTLRLLVDAGSPLHGSNDRRLSEELRRIALVLQSE